jgi:hypothetical protein
LPSEEHAGALLDNNPKCRARLRDRLPAASPSLLMTDPPWSECLDFNVDRGLECYVGGISIGAAGHC